MRMQLLFCAEIEHASEQKNVEKRGVGSSNAIWIEEKTNFAADKTAYIFSSRVGNLFQLQMQFPLCQWEIVWRFFWASVFVVHWNAKEQLISIKFNLEFGRKWNRNDANN